MTATPQTLLGWIINNGSGWNHHKTADALLDLLASSPDELPAVPVGHAILVAPISGDKPFGLRLMLVKVLPRITDEDGCDDGCDGDRNEWAAEYFRIDAERIASCTCEQPSDDDSAYFMRKAREYLKALIA